MVKKMREVRLHLQVGIHRIVRYWGLGGLCLGWATQVHPTGNEGLSVVLEAKVTLGNSFECEERGLGAVATSCEIQRCGHSNPLDY
jgi:hypothetical protein